MVIVPNTILENYIIISPTGKQEKQYMLIRIHNHDWLHMINHLINEQSAHKSPASNHHLCETKGCTTLHTLFVQLTRPILHDSHGITRRHNVQLSQPQLK